MNAPKSVLFVCLGNICRSPSAEAVMTKLAHDHFLKIRFDSAGTADYHIGKAPDHRAIEVGESLGYKLSHLRARQLTVQDFYDFDIIFAMDAKNLEHIRAMMPANATARVGAFDRTPVADPYYGDISDFDVMFEHIEQASKRWIDTWKQHD